MAEPPKIKLRQDLEFIKRALKFEDFWVVKDPVSFKHFLFSNHEYHLLKLFDGIQTDTEIQQQWQRQFRTSSLTIEQVREFANRAIRDNLVLVQQFGFGGMLFRDAEIQRKQKLKSTLTSPLAIRFRGFNPRMILDSVAWLGWVMFHPIIVILMMLGSAAVLIYMVGHFDDLAQRIPTISQLLSAHGLIGIVATISIVKILHELGHAMACRRCGGECFEIGVILLAFIPTLYCNVSDAWTFPQRWKRLLVSFGGIYVEIILAAIAAVVWLNSGPGLLNAIMFNVVALCSINTLLINGNPLLRYDGYYLLSDLTERPNLSQVAKETLSDYLISMFRVPLQTKPTPSWILFYSLLSFVYRWFVVGAILVMVYLFLKNNDLRVAGQYLILLMAIGIIWRPLMALKPLRKRQASRKWGQFSVARAMLPIFLTGLASAFFFYVPVAGYVRCNLSVQSTSPNPVYVPSNGKLVFVSGEGQTVKPGQLIARIESVLISQELQRIKSNLDRNLDAMEQLKLRANQDPLAAAEMAITQKAIDADQEELKVLRVDESRLRITAPIGGVVYPAPLRKSLFTDAEDVSTWEGHLTDKKNLHCFVRRGEQLLAIQAPKDKTVTLLVGEREIDFVKKGQSVQLLFHQCPGKLYEGTVKDIFEVGVNLNESMGDTGMETYQDAAGNLRSLQTPYRVTVEADQLPINAYFGSGGRARITAPSQTLAQKTKEFFQRLAKLNL